ncbi:MAG: hypothetical protein VX619_05830, partial [bacterium]|nr:hypothetical protein [bacterium]
SVIGANKDSGSHKLKDGLNRLRELHYRMSAANANETYLMKLSYFLVRQYTLVLKSGGNVQNIEMINQFLNLEAWFFSNRTTAKKLIKGFEKGLSYLRTQIRKYSLKEYRLRKMEIAKEQLHDNYSVSLGHSTSKVRGRQGQCANKNFSRSDCYECASFAVAKALNDDFQQTDPWYIGQVNRRLNDPPYANQFHHGWIEEQDRNIFRLSRVFEANDTSSSERELGMQTALDAPLGSVLIWSICGTHPAGHIAIKTSETVAASSFSAPIQKTCGNPKAQIIGVYTPVDNGKTIRPLVYDFHKNINAEVSKFDEDVEEADSNIKPDDKSVNNLFGDINF